MYCIATINIRVFEFIRLNNRQLILILQSIALSLFISHPPADNNPSAPPTSSKVSRSGRVIKQPLEYWKGGRVLVDAHMNVTVHESYDSSFCTSVSLDPAGPLRRHSVPTVNPILLVPNLRTPTQRRSSSRPASLTRPATANRLLPEKPARGQ